MASYCPNCNYKLSLIDTKPECPVCGVNLMYFGMEERLKEEADKAEFEHAMTQPHIDRLKAASIGSPLAIARLVIAVLTLAASIAPFAHVVTTLPFNTIDKKIGLINVVTDVYMNLDFDYYFKMFNDALLGKGYLFEFIALILFTLSLVMALYSLTMPRMRIERGATKKSLDEALGLNAFKLFLNPRMAMFFIFAMLLGVCLQITNGFANPFITSFGSVPEYADTFGVQHANILISLSQMSETLCILLIPFFLSKFGIKRVVLIALLAWVLRFAFFGLGNPGGGVWLFVLSMIVYGVAFDFFNISGSLFVNQETDESIRSSAQGLFMMMTNGLGAFVGTIIAQQIINHYVFYPQAAGATGVETIAGWQTCWFIFAGYALVVAVLFALFFKDSKKA